MMIICSYRTYEEWKHSETRTQARSERVLTVPMRNGNLYFLLLKRLGEACVLTVPMRNGNKRAIAYTATGLPVLTVPMRNGNDVVESLGDGRYISSYRTYEEWKPK